ncbi:DNA polymerase III, subunits gamma and tau [Planctopirus limnophila DSM 3776]|uniref:DNA polymerase III subunit gamma/tau n=1 Tax=Planctopirus limnophila (strain ATCC 43296 / DSM 3776 / IFAM 1008 / Mu 290) TaxID=521674 RepID=D5SRK5_PLAL2|nr:DNA polymerase III subunit gamma/tau [Planctopirus limnophila]ADG66539.1 DNA polymerase III, subunits gamma and tau [Planctopirus limnophila DSM 3776]
MNVENYTVLARRFRPQTFSEVVGQDRIAQTLRNAILEGRVAHAYLFTGARGVGKTSMARIFAKALNCPNAVEAVPCNTCEICRAVSAGQDVDVSEIDGASNRGIDDIRTLRANVNVKSMRTRYKVYIIDEVHMLTKEAFNALLKTLEEPPQGVKFIFCTTEPNKLPDTILSRCQRFDFGTVNIESIGERLRQIANTEGFQVDDEAIELVSRRANGSMRDSQSLFDQVLAFGHQHVTVADVHRLLGTASDDRVIELVQALIDRHAARALEALDQAILDGVQLDALTDQLISYLRDLMVTAAGVKGIALLGATESSRSRVETQAEAWGLKTISAALQILAEAKIKMARATWGRALTELALVRITLLEDLSRLDELIARFQGKSIPATSSSGRLATDRPMNSSPRVLPPPVAIIQGSPESRDLPDVQESQPEFQSQTEPQHHQHATANTSNATVVPVSSDATVSVDSSAEASSISTSLAEPELVFQPGNEATLLEYLRTKNTDLTGIHLQRATHCQITGPTQLEIVISANHRFEQQCLEQPNIVSKLEQQLRTATGTSIRLRFTTGSAHESSESNPLIHSESPSSKDNPASSPNGQLADGNGGVAQPETSLNSRVERQPLPHPSVTETPAIRPASRTVEDPEDRFVQSIGAAFGIDCWRVHERERIVSVEIEENSDTTADSSSDD